METGDMVPRGKTPTAKPDKQSSNRRTHMLEGGANSYKLSFDLQPVHLCSPVQNIKQAHN